MKFRWFPCVLFVASVTAYAGEVVQVANLAGWRIVTDATALPSEKYAAEELKALLKQSHGLDLPIEVSTTPAPNSIYIGPGKALASSPVPIRVEDLGEEGLRIRITPENIAIAGGPPRGTLYGVYEFAERYLGVRFLTFDHTSFPSPAVVEIPCGEYSYTPVFSFRWPYYQENTVHPEFAAKLRVNTVTDNDQIGGKTHQSLINHSLMRLLPVDKYGQEHPEYYALVDGERKLEMGGGGPEVCVTNPAVIETVAENAIAKLTENPEQQNISVSQNDNDAYCHCPNCEAVNQAEGTPMGSQLAFVNGVAERVEQKFPNVKIGTLAYWYTRRPPKTIQPRKNVQIQLCSIECCTLHPLNDPKCQRNRQFFEEMMKWKAVCNDIWIWHYNTDFGNYDLPFPNLRAIGPNIRFFSENNVKGVFMQADGNGMAGEMSDLRNYVIARCLWNPALDGWSQVEEFCRLHYGKAADTVLEYLVFLHDNAEKREVHPSCFAPPNEIGLDAGVSLEAHEILQRALGLAEDETVRARVEKLTIYTYKALLETTGGFEYKDQRYQFIYPTEIAGALDRYTELCQRHGVTMASELRKVEDYQAAIRKALEGYPAVEIQNPVWKLGVVPSANGAMVELLHKPSARNLLASAGLKNVGISFDNGDIEELWADKELRTGKEAFESTQTGTQITMTRALEDGSTIQRRIWLDESEPGKIFFETTLHHLGEKPRTYQIKIRPEMNAGSNTLDSAILSAYILGNGWEQFNKDWHLYSGPDETLLTRALGGGYAFFNHEAGYGVKINYHPEQLPTPKFWWNPEKKQANLELITRKVELEKGVQYSFDYTLEYLDKAPQ